MSGEQTDPPSRDLDDALRDALRLADAIDPASDGLDQIRTKIVARQERRGFGWDFLPWIGGIRLGRWRSFRLSGGWLITALRAVIERFRPDPSRSGWFGWLRPAAAVATGLFVVAGASWAVAALPDISPSHGRSHATHSVRPSAQHHHRPASSSSSSYPTGSGPGGYVGPGGSGTQPGAAASCSPTPTTSPSGTPTGSPSPSPSGTPTGSPSPSTSPSGTPTPSTNNSPGSSPTPEVSSSGSPAAQVTPEAIQHALLTVRLSRSGPARSGLSRSGARRPGLSHSGRRVTQVTSAYDSPAPAPSDSAPSPTASLTPQPNPSPSSPCAG
jgi:hypothetical protein